MRTLAMERIHSDKIIDDAWNCFIQPHKRKDGYDDIDKKKITMYREQTTEEICVVMLVNALCDKK